MSRTDLWSVLALVLTIGPFAVLLVLEGFKQGTWQ